MQRTRTIAGTPMRPASAAWTVIVTLLTDTLERSTAIPHGAVGAELTPLTGLGAAMVASGHLADHPLIVVAGDLRLEITVRNGDDAFTVEENLDPVLGGASAPAAWTLFLPTAPGFAADAEAAADGSEHLSVGSPPPAASKQAASATARIQLDDTALRQLGGR